MAVQQAVRSGVLLKSSATEAELLEVITRPYLARVIAAPARARLVELMQAAELVTVTERIAACRGAKAATAPAAAWLGTGPTTSCSGA